MLGHYTAAGNTSMIRKFEQYPIFESDEELIEYSTSSLRAEAMHDLGVGIMRHMNSVIKDIFFASLHCTQVPFACLVSPFEEAKAHFLA